MKRMLLLCALVFCGSFAFSQEDCHDMIFTADGQEIIFICCIKKIVDGNVVIYSRDGETFKVPATAICKDGIYQDLVPNDAIFHERYVKDPELHSFYRNHDYYYYKQLYDVAKTRQVIGILVTSVGLGIGFFGWALPEKNDSIYFNHDSGDFILIGLIYASVGVPLWISGAVMAENNKKAMDEIRKAKSLGIGINRYGIGVAFRF